MQNGHSAKKVTYGADAQGHDPKWPRGFSPKTMSGQTLLPRPQQILKATGERQRPSGSAPSPPPSSTDLDLYWEKTGEERTPNQDVSAQRETQNYSCSEALRHLSKIASALVLLQHPFSSATPTPNHDTISDRPTSFTLLRWLEETSQESPWSSLSPRNQNAPATAFQVQRLILPSMPSKTSSQTPKAPDDKPNKPSS